MTEVVIKRHLCSLAGAFFLTMKQAVISMEIMNTVLSITKKGRFCFAPDDPIYRDHFPGYPVVPGSLIIHAFMSEIGKVTGDATAQSISNFRFKRFLSPGCYAYRIEPKSDGRLACFLYDEDKAVVTGTL